MLWGIFEYISSLLFFFLHVTSSGSFPKALTKAEEARCLERMAAGDKAARQKLIEHNLRLVARHRGKSTSPMKRPRRPTAASAPSA